MKNLKVLAGALHLIRERERAGLRGVPGPQAVLSHLQGMDLQPGDEVIDSVTGQRGVILGTGIRNIESEGP